MYATRLSFAMCGVLWLIGCRMLSSGEINDDVLNTGMKILRAKLRIYTTQTLKANALSANGGSDYGACMLGRASSWNVERWFHWGVW